MLQITPKNTRLAQTFVVDNYSERNHTLTYFYMPLCEKELNEVRPIWYNCLSPLCSRPMHVDIALPAMCIRLFGNHRKSPTATC